MDNCEHKKSMQVGTQRICEDCFVVLEEWYAKLHPTTWDLSRCKMPPPKGRVVDNVLRGYKVKVCVGSD